MLVASIVKCTKIVFEVWKYRPVVKTMATSMSTLLPGRNLTELIKEVSLKFEKHRKLFPWGDDEEHRFSLFN